MQPLQLIYLIDNKIRSLKMVTLLTRSLGYTINPCCYRYGQKHDVVVVNFLNIENASDQRVYELLDQKFKLFDGVFGSSDEVLGAIGNGVDFEERIAQIYNDCRTVDEIKTAIDNLQNEAIINFAALINNERQEIISENANRNRDFFDVEIDKLDQWADDMKISLEKEIILRKAEAKKMLNLEAKVKSQKQIKELEKNEAKKDKPYFLPKMILMIKRKPY